LAEVLSRHDRGRSPAAAAIAVAGALLGACTSAFEFSDVEPRSATWRQDKEKACLARMKPMTGIEKTGAVNENDVCGMEEGLKVSALQNGAVTLSPTATLGCPLVETLDVWLAGTVQPAASAEFGSPVVEVKQISAYACRKRNNVGKEFSEHAFGNALDIAGFKLANGRTILMTTGWRGKPDEQAFLRKAFAGACQLFTTSLGPGSNIMHYNHFHLDLAVVAPDGSPKMCKPNPREFPGAGSTAPVVTASQETPATQTAVPTAAPTTETAIPGAD
jgi:hypothetical protein